MVNGAQVNSEIKKTKTRYNIWMWFINTTLILGANVTGCLQNEQLFPHSFVLSVYLFCEVANWKSAQGIKYKMKLILSVING